MGKAIGPQEIKLVPIGNSKGIRLPKTLLEKYGWLGIDSLQLEETEHGLLLHGAPSDKLSWKETFRAMAAETEDWSDCDEAVADGLDGLD